MSDQSRKLMSDADEQRRHNREASERLDQESGGRDGMSKHTPGPWVTSRENVYEYSRGHLLGAKRICVVDDWIPSNEANARLIAAAPDLFESLRLLIKEIDRWEEAVVQIVPSFARSGKWESLEQARAAIARAETP